MTKNKKNVDKEFGLSSWAINNKTTMYVLIAVFFYLGVSAFFSMPRESFPEVNETKIYVSSVFPGNTAEDIEKLMLEKNVPALGIGIIENGSLRQVKVYGELKKNTPAPYNAIFNVASLSKPISTLFT